MAQTEIQKADVDNLKKIARKGKAMADEIENFVKEIEPLLKKAYLQGETPFEIRVNVGIRFKVLKPKSK